MPLTTSSSKPVNTPREIVVSDRLGGMRLDRVVVESVDGLSRNRAQEAIVSGAITVNGRRVKASFIVEPGMVVQITVGLPPEPHISGPTSSSGASGKLAVVYEDEHLLVIDKAPGIVVHPAPGHSDGTVVDLLKAYLPGLRAGGDETRPGIVHRLDKDTSGLLIVAKTDASHLALTRQMKAHRIVKRYIALVEGEMPATEGVIDAPIGRDPRTRQRMALVSVAAGGRESRTRFRVLRTMRGRSLLQLELETGRTHQIRVHLAAIKHPVVGDATYGRAQSPLPPRQFLHAAELEFAHPVTGQWLTLRAPLAPDLQQFLDSVD